MHIKFPQQKSKLPDSARNLIEEILAEKPQPRPSIIPEQAIRTRNAVRAIRVGSARQGAILDRIERRLPLLDEILANLNGAKKAGSANA